MVQPNAIPALVSEDLFNKVQEKLTKNKKAPARHKAEDTYLLTTKLYCGKCGALMFGESGVSHTGKMYTYYKCAAAKKKKTCDKKAVRKQWLEDLVVSETMKLVEDDASMNAIIAKVMELQNQESTDLPIYEKQLKETEVGITNMLNAIQMGILTSSTKERLEALEEQRKDCLLYTSNSSKYVSYKDLKALTSDLKAVYAAVDEQAALDALETFAQNWDNKYPKIAKSWQENWTNLSTYFKYPQDCLLYTSRCV